MIQCVASVKLGTVRPIVNLASGSEFPDLPVKAANRHTASAMDGGIWDVHPQACSLLCSVEGLTQHHASGCLGTACSAIVVSSWHKVPLNSHPAPGGISASMVQKYEKRSLGLRLGWLVSKRFFSRCRNVRRDAEHSTGNQPSWTLKRCTEK